MSPYWVVPNWNNNNQLPHQTTPQSQQQQQEDLLSHSKHLPKCEDMEVMRWGQLEDTLESIVQSSVLSRKRTRSNPECCKDQTLMSWASFESPNIQQHDASASEEEHDMKGKIDASCSTRPTRAAINHNHSERRRRDRINQKLKDLQKLVPNGSKTDRASLLDDTIQYLKQLQAQVQFMCSIRASTQMAMPLGIQQQLQMSLLARMGLLVSDSMAAAPCVAAFAPSPPLMVPSTTSTSKPKANLSTTAFIPPTDPFCTFLAQQSMNMDLYSKMVTLYCQEAHKTPRQQTSK